MKKVQPDICGYSQSCMPKKIKGIYRTTVKHMLTISEYTLYQNIHFIRIYTISEYKLKQLNNTYFILQ